MNIKPITPNEIQDEKNLTIPDYIIESVNEILVKKWSGTEQKASFTQDELMELVLSKNPSKTREQIFEDRDFDFEDFYRKLGWNVYYNKGQYYDTFPPYFVFRKETKE